MNETRYDWLADRWVIFAPNREERPDEFKSSNRTAPSEQIECPFCYGAEKATPDPTLILPEIDLDATTSNRRKDVLSPIKANWQVRVVPNKFPAVPNHHSRTDATLGYENSMESYLNPIEISNTTDAYANQARLQTISATHLFQKHTPHGAHEVIIETPSHVDSITALNIDQISLIFEAYRRRLCFWRSQPSLQYAVIFKNYGADAGASLVHAHSQLISLDFVPRDIERIHERLSLHYEQYGRCYVCQMVEEEEERQERIVIRTKYFVAICPFASRFPFSFSIIPRLHRSCFENISVHEIKDLAFVVQSCLKALESAKPSAAYNFVLQTSPFRTIGEQSHHWRLRVIPRMSKVAGFEWGSDCFINTVIPETAARVLREHLS